MAFITLKCPSCGAALDIDDSRELAFCSYCGTKLVQEKTVIEHRGTISVDGIATKKNLIQRSSVYLKDGDFENAEIYFNKTLDTDPKCSQAYWGLLLCKHKSKNNTEFVSNATYNRIELRSNTEFLNACEVATEEELAVYKKMESIILNGIIKSINEEKGLSAQFFKLKKGLKNLAAIKITSAVFSAMLAVFTLAGSSNGKGYILFFSFLTAIAIFGIIFSSIKSKKYDEQLKDCFSKLKKFPDYKKKYVLSENNQNVQNTQNIQGPSGVLQITRHNSFAGSLVPVKVYLAGKLVASISNGQNVSIRVPYGAQNVVFKMNGKVIATIPVVLNESISNQMIHFKINNGRFEMT